MRGPNRRAVALSGRGLGVRLGRRQARAATYGRRLLGQKNGPIGRRRPTRPTRHAPTVCGRAALKRPDAVAAKDVGVRLGRRRPAARPTRRCARLSCRDLSAVALRRVASRNGTSPVLRRQPSVRGAVTRRLKAASSARMVGPFPDAQ